MNDPWLESWLECQRITARANWRCRLWLNQRRLRRAERTLGELGWQQAEFDPRDTGFIALQGVEQQQARLLFEIAETKEQIETLQSESETKTATLQTAVALAADNATRCETHALRLAESLALERNRHAADYLLQSIAKSIASEEKQLHEHRAEQRTHQENLTTYAEKTHRQLEQLRTSLKSHESRLHSLQQKKAVHYMRLGHDLADVGLAPINQPEILTRVLALRKTASHLFCQLADSLSQTYRLPCTLRFAAITVCIMVGLAFIALVFLMGAVVISKI